MDDLTPEKLRQLDQMMAVVADNWPPYWWRMYENLLKEGFDKEQSLLILRTYIHGTAGGRME